MKKLLAFLMSVSMLIGVATPISALAASSNEAEAFTIVDETSEDVFVVIDDADETNETDETDETDDTFVVIDNTTKDDGFEIVDETIAEDDGFAVVDETTDDKIVGIEDFEIVENVEDEDITVSYASASGTWPNTNGYNNNYGYNGYNYSYPYNADNYVYEATSYSYSSITSKFYNTSAATRLEIVLHYMALLNNGNSSYYYDNNGYNYNNDNNYNNYNGYNYGYNNNSILNNAFGYNYGYNNYPYLSSFADYNNFLYSYTSEELSIMDEAARIGLLRGIEENGRNYAAPERNVTRAQYAAFTNRAMQLSRIATYGYYQLYNFQDVPVTHWAYQDIAAMVAAGIMNGYNQYQFGTEQSFKSEDALITYYRLFVQQSYRYDYQDFATVINGVGYWWLECNGSSYGSYMNLELADLYVGETYTVRVSTNIAGFYNNMATWRSSNTSIATVDNYGNVAGVAPGTVTITATCNGISGSVQIRVLSNGNSGNTYSSWYFTKKTVPLNVGDTLALSSVMNTYPSGITFNVSGNGISISNGIVTANNVGTYTITGNANGITDQLTITVSNPGSAYPVVTQSPTELKFDQSTITVQRGEYVNLYDHLVNKFTGVTFTSADNNYVSISGNNAYANQVTTNPITITAYYGSYSATVRINVVDNNAAENLTGIRVSYSNFNTTGTCNVTVTGIPSGYTVKINNGDYQASYIEKASTSTAVQLQVTGLYPEGGRDALIVCIYNAQGVQVWEDPQGAYCPQTNSYF